MIAGFVIFAGLLLCGALIGKRLRYVGLHCIETAAVVQSGCVYLTEDSQRYVGLVLYSYRAAAQTYYGTCERSFTTPKAALHFIEDCGSSQPLARYKREQPDESYLFAELDDRQRFAASHTTKMDSYGLLTLHGIKTHS